MIGDLELATKLAATLLSAMNDVPGTPGQSRAAFRRDLGALQASVRSSLKAGTFASSLSDLFDEAADAGFAAADFATLRASANDLAAAASETVGTVGVLFMRLCLVAEARLWSAATFQSRDQVDNVRAVMASVFDQAIEDAADAGSAPVVRALTTLGASLQRHLISTARPLPRMITYSTARPLPSLVLAHRLYQDASRRDELEAENGVSNPLFMPTSGKALSA